MSYHQPHNYTWGASIQFLLEVYLKIMLCLSDGCEHNMTQHHVPATNLGRDSQQKDRDGVEYCDL